MNRPYALETTPPNMSSVPASPCTKIPPTTSAPPATIHGMPLMSCTWLCAVSTPLME